MKDSLWICSLHGRGSYGFGCVFSGFQLLRSYERTGLHSCTLHEQPATAPLFSLFQLATAPFVVPITYIYNVSHFLFVFHLSIGDYCWGCMYGYTDSD